MRAFWARLMEICWGVPGSAMPMGCLTLPYVIVYGLWLGIKSLFTGKDKDKQ